MIGAESAIPEGPRHIGETVFAHDIEGEAACAGHDAGVVADAAFVLVARDVADIVVAVLDAPRAPDGGCPFGGGKTGGGRDVEGDLAALAPQAGGGGMEQGVSGDADDGLDEGPPLGPDQGVADREDLNNPIFLARSTLITRERRVGGRAVGGDGATVSSRLDWLAFTWTRRWLPVSRAISNVF